MNKYYRVLNTKEVKGIESLFDISIAGNIYIGEVDNVFDGETSVNISADGDSILLNKDSVQAVNLYLSMEQINKLFTDFTDLIKARGNNSLLNEFTLDNFKEYINDCRNLYIQHLEEEEFYKYIEDNLYSLICYEV